MMVTIIISVSFARSLSPTRTPIRKLEPFAISENKRVFRNLMPIVFQIMTASAKSVPISYMTSMQKYASKDEGKLRMRFIVTFKTTFIMETIKNSLMLR